MDDFVVRFWHLRRQTGDLPAKVVVNGDTYAVDKKSAAFLKSCFGDGVIRVYRYTATSSNRLFIEDKSIQSMDASNESLYIYTDKDEIVRMRASEFFFVTRFKNSEGARLA